MTFLEGLPVLGGGIQPGQLCSICHRTSITTGFLLCRIVRAFLIEEQKIVKKVRVGKWIVAEHGQTSGLGRWPALRRAAYGRALLEQQQQTLHLVTD
jgi:hypothetical protein